MTPAARLGDPLDLKADVRLRNRIVATAHGSGAIADGLPVAGDAEYWGRVAAGGAAMVITGGTVVSADSSVRRGNFTEAWRPEVKPGLRRRADAIHAAGAVALVQLVHLGRETLGAESYYAPVAPSAVRSRREPTAPRALGNAEIATLVQSHRVSAEHALEKHGLWTRIATPDAPVHRRQRDQDEAGAAREKERHPEVLRIEGRAKDEVVVSVLAAVTGRGRTGVVPSRGVSPFRVFHSPVVHGLRGLRMGRKTPF